MPKVTITVRQHAASATLPHVTVRRFTIPRERAAEAERAPRSRSRGEDGGRDPRRPEAISRPGKPRHPGQQAHGPERMLGSSSRRRGAVRGHAPPACRPQLCRGASSNRIGRCGHHWTRDPSCLAPPRHNNRTRAGVTSSEDHQRHRRPCLQPPCFARPRPRPLTPRLPVADPRQDAAGPPSPGPLLAPRHRHVTRLPRSNWTADTPAPTFVRVYLSLFFFLISNSTVSVSCFWEQ